MPTNNDYFDGDMGVLWVQPLGANTPCYPIPCANLDGVDAALGDTATRLCRGGDGKYSATHRSQGIPSEATFTIETWLPKVRGYLQKQVQRRCPMPVYLHHLNCGRLDTFLNYDHGELLANSIITSKGKGSLVRGMVDAGDGPADMATQAFDMSAEPEPEDYWKLVMTNRSNFAEIEALRDIWFSDDARCLGACGGTQDICERGSIAANATAAAQADIWYTNDGVVSATAIASVFGVTINVASVTRFFMDRDTIRMLVALGTAGAAGMRVQYADYDIPTATWSAFTAVVVSALPAADLAAHGGALFSFDAQHIWLCTSLGYIWFSDDGGLTWTDQGAPVPGAGAEALYCVRFVDYNYGVCVGGTTGASSVYMSTTDGGVHWTLGTGPVAKILTGCTVIDGNRVWVCDEDGGLYYSLNYGGAWTTRTIVNKAPSVLGDVDFIDEFCGFAVGVYNDTDDYPAMYRTFNGGQDWEVYTYPTAFDDTGALNHFGLNAVWVCDYNHAFAVGEPIDSLGLVLELSAAGGV